ncbi:MAG: beta-galactosidase [Anaerolineae bacterium]|nr:beta-galactosidase [Anaerolineae bacterium]
MTRHLKTRYRLLLWLLPLLLVALTYSIAAPSALRAVTPEPAPETATPLPSPPAAVETALDTMATFVPLDDYLANPGMGWQETQTLDNPSLPETTAYRRSQYSWQDQNPAENSFNWSAVDADIQKMASQGKQLSFRIYTMRGEQWGGHQTPQWVLSKGAVILPSGEPDYSNCVYQAQWAKFVEAMRKKYDGNPTLAFIDISGYGNFNEWSWQEQTNVEEGSLDSQARRRLADMFIGGSGSVQCRNASSQTQSVSYNYPGFQKTQLLMPYAGIQQSLRYVAGRRADVIRDWPINANIAAWMPADPLPGSSPQQAVNQTLQLPSTVRSGAYTIRVAIINRRTGQPINLAFPNRDAQGRYLVGTINVLPSSSSNNSTTFLPLISKG